MSKNSNTAWTIEDLEALQKQAVATFDRARTLAERVNNGMENLVINMTCDMLIEEVKEDSEMANEIHDDIASIKSNLDSLFLTLSRAEMFVEKLEKNTYGC